jgi:ElaB/YqjD/DUF883 family membrane-anchored ribosome-binding protein
MQLQERRMDVMTEESVSGARRLMDSAQDAAARAGSYVQAGVGRLSDRAQDLADDAGDRLAQARHAVGAWTASARDTVKTHPVQAMAATVGVGYVIGKLLRRR